MDAQRATACAVCRAGLAVDNRSGLCSPCVRRSAEVASAPPSVPLDLWTSDRVTSATERRDFGALLKAYRESFTPPITQAALAYWLDLIRRR